MIEIDNTIISLDIIEKEFSCNLFACKGICCVEGDSGAPLTDEEATILEKELDNILPYVDSEHVDTLRKNGVYYVDRDGEKVTMLHNKAQCAFVKTSNGISSCGIELAYKENLASIPKPISCHLYPIRIKKFYQYEALNYDVWDICSDAVCKGKKEGIKIYEFLKQPLIRKYGEKWYSELQEVAESWNNKKDTN